MADADLHRSVEAVWRLESTRLVAALVRITRDVGLAEDLAQDALEAALAQWPESGIPDKPGAWLMAVAKRRAIDTFRRRERQDRAYGEIEQRKEDIVAGIESSIDHVEDDVLRLMFICCHPALSSDAQITLTLRLLAGLTTKEIARSFLTSEHHDRRAHHPRQEDARRGRCADGGARRGRARRPALGGARRALPAVQRGLLGDGR